MYKEYIFFYIVILFLIVFNFVPYIILLNEIDKKTICKNFNMNFSFREKIILSFFSVLIYFTDSIGPILSVREILISKILGKNINKNKTER